MHEPGTEPRERHPDGRHLCVDGDRLCKSWRQRRDDRDEQDYLERHSPRFSLVEIGLVALLVILFVDAIGNGLARPNVPPARPEAVGAVQDDRHLAEGRDFSDETDLRR